MTPKSGMLLTEEEIQSIWDAVSPWAPSAVGLPERRQAICRIARRVEAAVLRKWGTAMMEGTIVPRGIGPMTVFRVEQHLLEAAAEAEKEAEGD